MFVLAAVIGSGTSLFLSPSLHALGAEGEVARLASRYLAVTVHSLPLIFGAFAFAVAWRITGKLARRGAKADMVLDAPVAAGAGHSASAALVTPQRE